MFQEFAMNYRCIKSFYFNKNKEFNWNVPWHQDLFISSNEKIDGLDYRQWTRKDDYWNVQPPITILENIVTLRIHLDKCDERNGCVKVILGSHSLGIKKLSDQDYNNPVLVEARAGDVLMMSPLILHASNKNTTSKNRQIVHLEFSNLELAEGMGWLEEWHL